MRLLIVALCLFSACAPIPAAAGILDDFVRRIVRPLLHEHRGVWYSDDYAEGSWSHGVVEALAACEKDDGGIVWVPKGIAPIDLTGVQSPAIAPPMRHNRNKSLSACTLRGYGSNIHVNHLMPDDMQALGSTLRFDNVSKMIPDEFGRKTGLAITASSQRMHDFSVMYTEADEHTSGILCRAEGWESDPPTGARITGRWRLSDVTLENITVFGGQNASTARGIGLDMQGCMGVKTIGGVFRNWRQGAMLGPLPLPSQMKNNSNVFLNTAFRDNAIGLELHTIHACSELLLAGSVIEGNGIGIKATEDADCLVTLISTHFEQEGQIPFDERFNIHIDAAGLTLLSLGNRFGGTMPEGHDIYRGKSFARYGSDVDVGSAFQHGPDYPGGWLSMFAPRKVNGASGYVVAGDRLSHPSNCQRHMALSHTGVSGRACVQMNDLSEWSCQPKEGVGFSGMCDMPEEVVCVSGCSRE